MNDPILLLLIDVAEEFAAKEGDNLPYKLWVTLTVGSILVCGDICSAKEFLMFDDLTLHRLARSVAEPGITPSGEKAFNDSLDDSVGFIHLRDVKFLVPGCENQTPARGVIPYWRGKLSAIDGFFLGRLDPALGTE